MAAVYPVEVDPYFDSVSLLLPLDGADASTAFPDASLNSHAVVPAGGAAITTGQSKFGGASVHLDGSSQSLNFPREALVDDPALTTISQAITIECWIYRTAASTSYEYILGATNYTTPFDGLNFQAGPTNRLRAIARNAGAAAFTIEAVSLIPLNEWVHAALTRSASGVWTIWQNGVEEATTTETIEVSLRAALVPKIGRDAETGFYWSGWIDDFKITRGVELYTQGFVPPATAHPTSRFAPGLEPAILDPYFAGVESLVQFDEGEGSLTLADEIDGTSWTFEGGAELIDSDGVTGSCLNVAGAGTKYIEADRPIFPATGDFTVELFAKAESYNASGENQLISQYDSSATGRALFGLQGGYLGAFLNPVGWEKSATLFPLDTWVHCAFVRSGNTLSVYQGGVLVASAAWNSSSIYTGHDAVVGAMIYQGVPQSGWDGLLDSFRFTSLARYTSAFTPPAEAFPNFEYDPLERLDLRTEVDPLFDYNALLLHCEGTAGTAIFTNVVDGLDATAINGAQIGSVDPKVGGGCLALGTTGQHLSYPEKPLYYLGDKLFTIEAWIYVNAHRGGTVNPIIIALAPNGGGAGTCWQLQFEPSGTILFQRWNGSAWQVMLSYTTPLATGAWVHLAVVREGMGAADIKLYIGGTFAKASTANYTDLETQVTGATELLIGGKSESQYGGAIDGKLDEVRITIGAARYTTDFTVPTEAFPDSRYIYADPGPNIVTQPVDSDLFEGQVASFTVVATGAGTIAYQWYETTAGLIAGATSATYVFSAVLGDDGKSYYCVLMDDSGVVNSDVASLAVASAHPVELDGYSDYLVSVLNFSEMSGASITDSFPIWSGSAMTWTAGGNASVDGNGWLTLDGAGDYINHTDIQDFRDSFNTVGSNRNWTIEFQYKANSVAGQQAIFGWQGYASGGLVVWQRAIDPTMIGFAGGESTSGFDFEIFTPTGFVSVGETYDIAITRNADLYLLHINGVYIGSDTYSGTLTLGAGGMKLGDAMLTGDLNGQFSRLRSYIGVSVYEQSTNYSLLPGMDYPLTRFAPGLEPAILDPYFDNVDSLLHFEGVDNDTTTTDLIAGTEWVISGDGAIKQISPAIFGETCYQVGTTGRLKTTSLLSIGAGDFTIECFLLAELDDSSRYVFDFRSVWNSSTGACLRFQPGNGGTLRYYTGGADRISGSNVILGAGSPVHIALCRKDGITRLFVNGTQDGSDYADTRDYSFSVGFVWGNYAANDTTNVGLNGWLDECRITIGAGRYGANFTVPTEAFPDFEYDPLERLDLRTEVDPYFDDTISLYHFEEADAASIANSASPVALDLFNSPVLSTTEKKYGAKSLEFATGSHAELRTNFSSGSTWADKGARDCTLEGFFYFNGADGYIVQQGASGAGSSSGEDTNKRNGAALHLATSGQVTITAGNLGTYGWTGYMDIRTVAGAVPFNEWVYVALVIKSQVPKLYVNGVNKPFSPGSGSTVQYDFTNIPLYTTVPFTLNGKYYDAGARMTGVKVGEPAVTNSLYCIDELRFTNAARYSTDFTVPTEAFPDSRYVYDAAGPTITAQPVAESVTEGDTASFTVAATGAGTLTYQWHETTAGAIADATAATYSFVTAVAQDGDGYFCVVTDDVGSSTSITAALAVAGELLAGVTPTTVTVYPNADPVFTCTAFGGTGTKTYQWYGPGGLELSGETGTTLTLVDVVLGDSGKTFYCVVADDLDNVESNHATLVVEAPPALVVSVSPANDAAISGEDVTFTCSAVGGSGTKSYQWFESTAGALGGETGAALTITTTFPDHGNTYYCEVTDDYQTEATGIATLWVYPVLAIDAQPVGGAVGAGDPVTLTVTIAAGTAPYSYQWYQDGNAVTNETAPTLMMIATPGRAGDYTVNITDSTGQMVISDAATLTVSILAPLILTQPGSPRVNKGSSAQFEVSARGYGPLGYQWYRDGFAVSGATGYRYVLGPVTLEDDGAELYCIVTDGYGHSTQSDPGTLTVIRVHLDDQTEPMPASDIGPQKKPTYKHADFSGLVRAAKRGQSPFLPTYRFSGRTFKERE